MQDLESLLGRPSWAAECAPALMALFRHRANPVVQAGQAIMRRGAIQESDAAGQTNEAMKGKTGQPAEAREPVLNGFADAEVNDHDLQAEVQPTAHDVTVGDEGQLLPQNDGVSGPGELDTLHMDSPFLPAPHEDGHGAMPDLEAHIQRNEVPENGSHAQSGTHSTADIMSLCVPPVLAP